ncbi:ATP-binding protein [Rubrivivax rivuli]|nr:AAA family ATPase [Rubrivivax rivuli]
MSEPPCTPRLQLQLRATPRWLDGSGTSRDLPPQDGLLLAWLALEGASPRARLIALLWPDKAPDAARNALRQRLFQLRRLCGADLTEGTTVLALGAGVTHDLADAGSVLEGVEFPLGTAAATWLEQQRQRRRARAVHALVERSEQAEAAREWPEAIAQAREALALDPLSEPAHLRLMRLHYLAGDRAAALLAFDACERMLKDEVGARPSPEMLALLDTVQRTAPPAPRTRGLPVSVLRPPRLIGRDAERRALREALAAQQLPWLFGEAGFGKTRLLQEAAAENPGWVVAQARPGDGPVPYASLGRLLQAVLAARPGLRPVMEQGQCARVLGQVTAALVPAATPERDLHQVLAQARTLGLDVLVLDDLHHADEASLEMLLALTTEATADQPAWVFASRSADGGPALRQLHAALLERVRLRAIALGALSAAGVQEFVASLALPGLDAAALAPRLYRHAGGNPLFLLETLKALLLRPAGAQGDTLPPLDGIAQLIGHRLARCSPAALRLARCVALAGPDFSTALAIELLGVGTLDLADAWAELEAAQLLREQAFAHDLIHDAALASVPAPLARQMHGAIAALLQQRQAAPERIAAHWSASDTPAAAVPHLLAAGERALAALRPREACMAFEQAARLLEAQGDRHAAFEALDRWFTQAAPRREPDTLRLLDQLSAWADSPLQRATAAGHRAAVLERAGEWGSSGDTAAHALSLFEPHEAPELASGLMLQVAVGELHQGHADAALGTLFRALALAEVAGNDRRLAETVGTLGNVLMWVGRLNEAYPHQLRGLRLHEAGARPTGMLTSLLGCTGNRLEVGRHREAAEHLALADRLALQHELELSQGWPIFDGHRARLALDLGRFREALPLLEVALERYRADQPSQVIAVHNQLTRLWMRLGQWARARQSAQAALALSDEAAPVYAARALELASEVGVAPRGAPTPLAVYDEIRQRYGHATQRIDFALRLGRARHVPGAGGLAAVRALRDEAQGMGHGALTLLAEMRAIDAARRASDAEAAAEHACAALRLFETHEPYGAYRAEVWLAAASGLAPLDPPRARAVLAAGRAWVQETASTQVDAPFRESFLTRNPVNRELLSLKLQGPALPT